MNSTVAGFDAAHALKCELAAEALISSGSLRLQVTGWSMFPTIWPGDTLVIERIGTDAVREGDIVLFQRDRRFFVHRVITACSDRSVVTQGDSMPLPDPLVSEQELLGKVSAVWRRGKCLKPQNRLRFAGRMVAALMRRSEVAARVVASCTASRQTIRIESFLARTDR
jgi:signal peptidase I